MQISVLLHDVASQLFLLLHATVRIQPLVFLDVVVGENDRIPSTHVAGHRKLFKMIQKMQQEGKIRFTQLI